MAHNKVKIGNTTIMDITDASLDLASDEIASGKSGYDGNGDKISGSLQNVSGGSYVMDDTLSVVPLQGPIYIPTNGSFSVSTLSTNHTAENIKKDVQLLGVTGTYDPLADKEYCVSGSLAGGTNYEYHLPSSVTSIGQNAFYCQTHLQTINLDGITGSIGTSAFVQCTALTDINAPNTTSVGQYAFYGCSSLTNVDISNTTSVGSHAFYCCSALESIDTSNVTSIGSHAFYCCSALESIDTSNVTSIDEYAFYDCSTLESIDFSNLTSIPARVCGLCTSLRNPLLQNATSIGAYAFQGCTSLTSISISNVTSIGNSAFSGCSALTSISIPNVTIINSQLCYGCVSLTSVNLSSATEINSSAFYNCALLTNINAPNNEYVGSLAFYGCSALTNITVKNGVQCSSNSSSQSKVATVGSKTYMVKGTGTINIYDASDPATILGSISSSSTTYTDSDTGATFTRGGNSYFTLTW